MLNYCSFIGRLGSDPDMRYTADSKAVANISIGCSESWKDKSGEKDEKTEWVRGVAFGKLAEIMGEYLRKGSLVFISGKMQTRKWQDKEGQDRYTTEIVINDMKMLGSKDSSTGDRAASNRSGQNPQESPATSSAGDDFDQDIPF